MAAVTGFIFHTAIIILLILITLGDPAYSLTSSPNIICTEETDRFISQVVAGVIQDNDIQDDRDCKMKVQVQGSVLVEVIVNSLYFSSNDCDEEYFCIKTKEEVKVHNTTLCNGVSPGTKVQYNFTASEENGSEVIFQLKMEEDSDKLKHEQSFINLSFNIREISAEEEETSPFIKVEAATTHLTLAADSSTRGSTVMTEPKNVAADSSDVSDQSSMTSSGLVTSSTSRSTPKHVETSAAVIKDSTIQRGPSSTPSYSGLSGDDQSLEDDDDEEDWDPKSGPSHSMRIDRNVIALSLGLVALLMTIIIVTLVLCLYTRRRKQLNRHPTAKRTISNDAIRSKPQIGSCLSNSYIGSFNRPSKKQLTATKSEPVYYAEYADIDDTTTQQKLSGDNYHRLESMSEASSTISIRQPSKVAKLSENRGFENEYVDNDLVQLQECELESSATSAAKNRDLGEDNNGCLDQFGYVIVLPNLSNGESRQLPPPVVTRRLSSNEKGSDYYEYVASNPYS